MPLGISAYGYLLDTHAYGFDSHDGLFPMTLSSMPGWPVPDDPVVLRPQYAKICLRSFPLALRGRSIRSPKNLFGDPRAGIIVFVNRGGG